MNQRPTSPETGLLPGGVSLDQIPTEVFASLCGDDRAGALMHLVRRLPMSLPEAKDCIDALVALRPPPPLPPLPPHLQRQRPSRKTT